MRTPKEMFLSDSERAKRHRDLSESVEFETLISMATLHYLSGLGVGNHPQEMIVNDAKRQGVQEFVKLLSNFGRADLKPVRKVDGILNDPDMLTR